MPQLTLNDTTTQRRSDMTSTRSLALKKLIVGAVIAISAPLFIFGGTSALTVDVTLDPDFGTNGTVTTSFGTVYDLALGATLQPDGKILVVGTSVTAPNYSSGDFAVVRYNSDGTLDTTFGTGGTVTTSVGPNWDTAYTLALQPDGKILAAGSSDGTSSGDFAVVRYNSDGTLDTTFGTGGKVTTSVGPNYEWINTLALQLDGKILAAGISYGSTSTTSGDFAVVRYNSDGTLDTTFGTSGIITTDFFGRTDEITAITVQSDGKILAAGIARNPSGDVAMVRYNSDGTLDTTFGTGGKVTTSLDPGDDIARSIRLVAEGKILLAGASNNNGRFNFALMRYNSDGTLDTTFGTGGTVTTKIRTDDVAFSMAIEPDGKIILGGGSTSIDEHLGSAVVRYNSDGTLDTTFGIDGIITTDFFEKNDPVKAVYLQSDGKILLVGQTNDGTQNLFAIARYNVTVNDPASETPETPSTPIPAVATTTPAVTATSPSPNTTSVSQVQKADSLPKTGSNTSSLLGTTGALILAGGLVIASRRRITQ